MIFAFGFTAVLSARSAFAETELLSVRLLHRATGSFTARISIYLSILLAFWAKVKGETDFHGFFTLWTRFFMRFRAFLRDISLFLSHKSKLDFLARTRILSNFRRKSAFFAGKSWAKMQKSADMIHFPPTFIFALFFSHYFTQVKYILTQYFFTMFEFLLMVNP